MQKASKNDVKVFKKELKNKKLLTKFTKYVNA